MLEDVASEEQVKDVRSDDSSVGSRGGLDRGLLLGVGLEVELLNVVEVFDALVGEVFVLDEFLLFWGQIRHLLFLKVRNLSQFLDVVFLALVQELGEEVIDDGQGWSGLLL
jgi:hypothetical protein